MDRVILQLLEAARHPEDMDIASFRFHGLQGNPKRWSVRVTGNLPDYFMKKRNTLPPVHPGEIIKEDILPSVGLSVTAAAKALDVSRQMLHDILAERKPLSAIMCLKVSRLFGGSREVMDEVAGDVALTCN